MIICICANYKSSDLREDIKNEKSFKDILETLKPERSCKKCSKYLKDEYKEVIEVLNI